MNIRQMRIAIGTYKARITGLTMQIEEFEAEVQRKNKVLDKQRKDLEIYSEIIGEHTEEYQDLEARNDSKIEEIQQLHAKIAEQNGIESALRDELDEHGTRIDQLLEESEEQEHENLNLQAAVALNERVLANVKNDRDGTNERLGRVVKRGQALLELRGQDLIAARTRAAKLETVGEERDLLKQELKLVSDSNRTRGAKLRGASQAGKELRATLEARNAELDVREHKIEHQSDRIDELETLWAMRGEEIRRLEDEIAVMRFDHEGEQSRIADLHKTLDRRDAKLKLISAQRDTIVRASEGFLMKIDRRDEQIDQLRAEHSELVDDMAVLRLQLEAVDRIAVEKTASIGQLRDELKGEQARIAYLNKSLDRRDVRIALFAKNATNHERLLATEQSRADELRADIASMRGAFEGALERAEELRSDLARAQQRTEFDPKSYYLVDWDKGLVDISRSFAEWHLAVRRIPSGHILGARYEILSGASVQKMIEPRFKLADGFDKEI